MNDLIPKESVSGFPIEGGRATGGVKDCDGALSQSGREVGSLGESIVMEGDEPRLFEPGVADVVRQTC